MLLSGAIQVNERARGGDGGRAGGFISRGLIELGQRKRKRSISLIGAKTFNTHIS